MGLFDKLKQAAEQAAGSVTAAASCKTAEVIFPKLPDTLEEFKALSQAQLSTPFDTAAMTVLALYFYPQNAELSLEMLGFLKGPQQLSGYDKQFLCDRFTDKDYVPRSYFTGATPAKPYTVRVSENPYSYQEHGYAKLFIKSGGADTPRYVMLRQAKDGKWYLWEQFLLSDIRQPESADPRA